MRELVDTPVIKDWMPPEEVVFRKQAVDYLHRAAEMGIIPFSVTNYGIFPEGESSVVFKVSTDSDEFVVKMALHPTRLATEAAAFTAWKAKSVNTPQVFSSHVASPTLPISLSVLEFIDAPTLSQAMATENRVDSGVSRELGRILARMHQVQTSGFGTLQLPGLSGNMSSLSNETLPFLDQRLTRLVAKEILTDSDVASVHRALAVLEEDSLKRNRSSLTHNDFLPYNILSGPSLVVIDPDALITHPLLDLATTLIISEIADQPYGFKEPKEILAGYQETEPVEPNLLAAAMEVRTVRKLNTWAYKNKVRQVEACVALLRREASKF